METSTANPSPRLPRINTRFQVDSIENKIKSFWHWVDIRGPNECWGWLGYIHKDGHPMFAWKSTKITAHRFSYEIHHGGIPKNHQAFRTCAGGGCVNPAHIKIKLRPFRWSSLTGDEKRSSFWRLVNKKSENECWEWLGSRDKNTGYGYFRRNFGAHRWSFLLANGKLTPGLLVCHKCDNKICVNPSHLFEGTYQDNNDDMKRKGRCVHLPLFHRSKITLDDFILIRKVFKPYVFTGKMISEKYGYGRRTVRKVLENGPWAKKIIKHHVLKKSQ